MLKLAAGIDRKRPISRPSRQSRNVIKALLLGAAVVINDCLSKVIAVCQRFAHNLGASRIGRFQAEFGIISAV